MEITEQRLTGKQSPETCEDTIVASPDYVAVVDGSTSKSRHQWNPPMSNGQYCAALVRQYIQSMPPHLSAPQFCKLVTAYIRFVYQRVGADLQLLARQPAERMAASAAIYSRHRREVWLVGDCQCLVAGEHHENAKPHEALIADMRSAYIRLRLLQGERPEHFEEHDDGRDFVLPFIVGSCRDQNRSFAVIDGFDIPTEKVKVVGVAPGADVVLATDGYPTLLPTLDESEEQLRRLLAADPLCIHAFKATKGRMRGNASFDDRAYVRFRAT